MGDINWYDRLWDVDNDEELFERAQEISAELIENLDGSKKGKNEFVKSIYELKLEDGIAFNKIIDNAIKSMY